MNSPAGSIVNPARLLIGGAAVLILGIILIMGGGIHSQMALHSYLFGWCFWMTLTLGCFIITLLQNVFRASWGLPILRIAESGGGPFNFLLMFLLFIPIIMNIHEIYPWANSALMHADPAMRGRMLYMNESMFIGRTIGVFAFWILVSFLLRHWSMKQEETKDINYSIKRMNLAAPCILLMVITVNFAFTDWVMSLMPHFYSTIFGVLFVIGSALLAIAFCIFVLIRVQPLAVFKGVMDPWKYRYLGELMLAFIMLWAYLNLSQYLIIWSGNLPEEIDFYLMRQPNGWGAVGISLVFLHFFLPFLILLAAAVKRNPAKLIFVASYVMFIRLVDVYYYVIPAFGTQEHQVSVIPRLTDLGALLLVGGAWLILYAYRLASTPILVTFDPRLQIPALQEAKTHA